MRKFMDLTGQKFGRLTVLENTGKKNGSILWLCQCDCSDKNFITVMAGNLKNGTTRSCGCLTKERIVDLTGQVFGRLTVLRSTGRSRKRSVLWLCHCECGNDVEINGDSLKNGSTKSCGCLQKELVSKRSYINLVGQKFGRLTVIDESERTRDGRVKFLCRCNCKNKTQIEVLASSLKGGGTQSCGCLKNEEVSKRSYINLSNKKFGMLTVIKDIGRKNGQVLWLCKCNCGNNVEAVSRDLRCGDVKSCGCLSESWVASELKKYYKKNHGAETEYNIFRNPKTNHYLPFDIFIPNKNIFIEIHGIQHYLFIKHFFKSEEDFEYRKKLDRMKRKFARKNGIYIEIDLRKINTPEKAIEYVNKFL